MNHVVGNVGGFLRFVEYLCWKWRSFKDSGAERNSASDRSSASLPVYLVIGYLYAQIPSQTLEDFQTVLGQIESTIHSQPHLRAELDWEVEVLVEGH